MKNFLVISFCSVILMSGNQLHASVNVNFAEYLPLHVGDSWTLVDEFSTYHNHQVVGTEFIDGKKTYHYTNWKGNPNYANLTYENGVLVVAGLDGTALDPPRIYDGQDIDNPFIHIVYEIVPSVETPAGIFYDVIKETIYPKINGQEIITRVQYFAKGVGLIKDEEWSSDSGGTYQYTALLTSYEVADLPWADIRTCISEQCYDAPQVIVSGTPLSIEIALIPWHQNGEIREIWIAAQSPGGAWEWWYTLLGWVNSTTPIRTYAGPFFTLPSYTALSEFSLPVGIWNFGIAVDAIPNTILDDLETLDICTVEVQ